MSVAPGALGFQLWSIPKPDAVSGRENEDRYSIRGLRPAAEPAYPLRIAISDGASDGLWAREWARQLTRAYCAAPLDALPDLTRVAEDAEASWRSAITMAAGGTLPWHLQARAERPTGATLLGFSLNADHQWSAQAVGDTCLVHLRKRVPLRIFPLQTYRDFASSPPLVQTFASPRPGAPVLQAGSVRTVSDIAQAGDDILMMTDALAAWFCSDWERAAAPWEWLLAISDGAEFRRRVGMLRAERGLRGDDTTLVHLRFAAVDQTDGTMG